ncbi:MAG: WhiB family transcriptional regulator, partial [Trebonia sp.]
MTQSATEWRAEGACLKADPDLFFPIAAAHVAARQIAKAQEICARCGVRQQCLDFAMQTGEANGIWGGTTPEERIRARRRVSARARRRAAGGSRPLAGAPGRPGVAMVSQPAGEGP